MTTATKTPKCFEKIATDSPTYLRRLAKEINERAYAGVSSDDAEKGIFRQARRGLQGYKRGEYIIRRGLYSIGFDNAGCRGILPGDI